MSIKRQLMGIRLPLYSTASLETNHRNAPAKTTYSENRFRRYAANRRYEPIGPDPFWDLGQFARILWGIWANSPGSLDAKNLDPQRLPIGFQQLCLCCLGILKSGQVETKFQKPTVLLGNGRLGMLGPLIWRFLLRMQWPNTQGGLIPNRYAHWSRLEM